MLKPVTSLVTHQVGVDLTNGLKYNYEQIAEADRRTVQGAAVEIKAHAERAKSSMIAIGQKLAKVKELLPYGQFGEWCLTEFEMSQKTAERMMNAAKVFGERIDTVSILSDSAQYMLSGPSVPEAAREEVIELAKEIGKSPTKAEVHAVINKHKFVARMLNHTETVHLLWIAIKANVPESNGPRDRLAWFAGLEPKADKFAEWLAPGECLDTGVLTEAYNHVLTELRRLVEVAAGREATQQSIERINATAPVAPSGPKRILLLDETIAVIYRVLKTQLGSNAASDRLTWLNKYSQMRDYEHALTAGVKLDLSIFCTAWATVAGEQRKAIENQRRTEEKATQLASEPPIVEAEAATGKEAAERMTITEALDGLDVVDLMLAEVGAPIDDKKALLLRLYEITLESMAVYEEITNRFTNNVTRSTIKGMIEELKKEAKPLPVL